MRVIGTAGHVDHGKSSLVLALTGTDPDRFEEEKRRGLTIDLGFAHTEVAGADGRPRELSFIDVPGHIRFLRNMLAGVGAIDACMFVVAATEGWKPQSEEHLRILEVLGLRHGIVVLTKSDLVDDEWLELATLDVVDHVEGTFLDGAPIMPVSAATGAGVDDLRSALAALADRAPGAIDAGRPRLWVDRSFAARGSGTIVTGTLTGGSLAVDERIDLLTPGSATAGASSRGTENFGSAISSSALSTSVRIRSIQSHDRTVDRISPGNRVALNLVGVDHDDIHRGDVIVHAAQWRPTVRFDASLDVLASLGHVVSRRGAYAAHIGSGEWAVRLRVLGPDSIHPGESGLVRLHLRAAGGALPLVAGDRFVLRESGRDETVGGGEVLDPRPVRPASKAKPDRSVDRVIAEHGWIDDVDLLALTGSVRPPTVGRWVVDPTVRGATEVRLRALINDAAATGAGLGLDLATLSDHDRALALLLDGVRIDAGRALPEAARDELADHPVLARLLAGGAAPPDMADLDRTTRRELIRRGLAFERDGVLFHPVAIELASAVVTTLLGRHPDGLTVSQFREELGVSRKYGVPLLTELDARGITRRRDDLRIGGPRLADPRLPAS